MSDHVSLRLFIAIDLHDEVRRSLSRLQDDLKETGANVSWVRPSNIHLTLVFLGDVVEKRVPGIKAVLDERAVDVEPFRFEVREAGCFGSARAPRVVWVGVHEDGGQLQALQAGVSRALHEIGFEAERRKFKPHLTLGRVRSPKGVGALTSALASAKNSALGWVEVDRLSLYQSRLDPEGAPYSVLHTSLLKGVETNGREKL